MKAPSGSACARTRAISSGVNTRWATRASKGRVGSTSHAHRRAVQGAGHRPGAVAQVEAHRRARAWGWLPPGDGQGEVQPQLPVQGVGQQGVGPWRQAGVVRPAGGGPVPPRWGMGMKQTMGTSRKDTSIISALAALSMPRAGGCILAQRVRYNGDAVENPPAQAGSEEEPHEEDLVSAHLPDDPGADAVGLRRAQGRSLSPAPIPIITRSLNGAVDFEAGARQHARGL